MVQEHCDSILITWLTEASCTGSPCAVEIRHSTSLNIMTTEFLKLLCSSAKLDRDRGVSMLEKNVQLYDCEVFKSTENALENFMVDQSGSWEIRLGGLLGVKTLLSQCGCHIKSNKNSCSSELYEIARQQSLKLLEDKECRVRTTAGGKMSIAIWHHLVGLIMILCLPLWVWVSPEYKAIPPELHGLESTYLVYPRFQLYASIVSSDNRSSRWLTVVCRPTQ